MDNTACAVSVNGSSAEVGVKLNLNAINAGVPGVHGGIYINQGSSVLYGDTRERMFKWGLNGAVVAELMKGTFPVICSTSHRVLIDHRSNRSTGSIPNRGRRGE